MTRRRKKRRGRGRPAWKPSRAEREEIRAMCAVGLLPAEVASIKGVTVKTLRKHCPDEIKNAGPRANAAVALALYKQATHAEKPNPVAAMFWLKCRAGWNDRPGGPSDLEAAKEGKKAAQKAAAAHIASSGRLKPSAPPRLAAVNGQTVPPQPTTTEPPK